MRMNDTHVATDPQPPNQEQVQVEIEKDLKPTARPSRNVICGLAKTNSTLPGHSPIHDNRCRLLDLPAELRLLIWSYVLTSQADPYAEQDDFSIQLSSVDQGVIKIERYIWPCECSPYCDCPYDENYDEVNVTDESWLP